MNWGWGENVQESTIPNSDRVAVVNCKNILGTLSVCEIHSNNINCEIVRVPYTWQLALIGLLYITKPVKCQSYLYKEKL